MIDRRVETPIEKLDSEARKVLYDRHDRIKKELRNNLASVIGVGGALITLSLTLLDKVAPNKHYLWLLAAAWIALGLSIVIALVMLLRTTVRSIGFQDTLADLYKQGKLRLFFRSAAGGTPGGKYASGEGHGIG